ncbi:hypothetical protein PIB30_045742 [Stylosanthes scabra]|uniref:Maturase K n=1 Tax=Stylosanthes scabra TaxID=79078 RepID=A0ABU6QFN6_9FABA|nr:hypothetical protein [Stylosanthes scabra]
MFILYLFGGVKFKRLSFGFQEELLHEHAIGGSGNLRLLRNHKQFINPVLERRIHRHLCSKCEGGTKPEIGSCWQRSIHQSLEKVLSFERGLSFPKLFPPIFASSSIGLLLSGEIIASDKMESFLDLIFSLVVKFPVVDFFLCLNINRYS